MAIRIFEQPNGQYAVYSITVDDFLLEDADYEELYKWYLDRNMEEINDQFDALVERAQEGTFVDTGPTSYEEAEDLAERN